MKSISGARWSIAVFLLAVLLASFLFPLSVSSSEVNSDQSSGEGFKKVETHYDIAVVFDNSLSMFYDNPNGSYEYIPRWSRAKFAMEIFASMLDLDGGDTLSIFPMWRVDTKERRELPEADRNEESLKKYRTGINDRVDIKTQKDIDDINRLFTISAGDTPFDPVENALQYLKGLNSGGDRDKWLIILTDGVFNMYGDEIFTVERLNSFNINEEIGKLGAQDIYIQYLSIDMPSNNPQKPAGTATFFVDEAQGAGIQDKLIEICNRIFQRDRLPNGDIEGATLHLGLSMRRLVVFVQGEGVEVEGLQDADGNKMAIASNSGQRKFSEYSVGFGKASKIDPARIKTDTSLYGQVVTFENCSAGDYTLSVKGSVASDKVQVFYEPDVRIKVELYVPGSDVPLAENDDNYKGERVLKCSIVDRVTGGDVSASPLLGTQNYTITVTNGGNTYDAKNGDTITLEPDAEGGASTIDVECAYLNGKYTIKNIDNPWSSARGGKQVNDFDPPPPAPEPRLVITLKDKKGNPIEETKRNEKKNITEFKAGTYVISKRDEWNPIRVEVKLIKDTRDDASPEDRQPVDLTDEQLKALKITLACKDDPNLAASSWKLLEGQSAFEISLYTDANGAFSAPDSGKKELALECELHVHSEKPAPANWYQKEPIPYESDVKTTGEVITFDFSKLDPIIEWIIRLAVALAIIALVLWFMSRKVLPKKIVKQSIVYTIGGKQIQGQNVVNYNRKGKHLSVRSAMPPKPEQECRISFSLYPVGRRWTPSRRRKFGINGISGPSMGVKSVTLNGITYNRDKSNKFVAVGANPDDPIKDESIGAMIVVNASRASLNCVLVQK